MKDCDELDGVKDGVIDDPTICNFEVSSLLCRDGQVEVEHNRMVCLSNTQLGTFQAFYTGPGADVYPGFAKGSESEWLMQEEELYTAYAVPILQNLIFRNLSYDYKSFDFREDVKLVDEVAGPLITATSPRLDAFRARGGKLIATQGKRICRQHGAIRQQYIIDKTTGWADPFNAPNWPIDQHTAAKEIYGEEQLNDFWRLFMVPGGGHCGSAASYPQVPGTYHSVEALISWVEDGSPPDFVVATKPADGSNSTKKLCPYPAHAVITGPDTHRHESYRCGTQHPRCF